MDIFALYKVKNNEDKQIPSVFYISAYDAKNYLMWVFPPWVVSGYSSKYDLLHRTRVFGYTTVIPIDLNDLDAQIQFTLGIFPAWVLEILKQEEHLKVLDYTYYLMIK